MSTPDRYTPRPYVVNLTSGTVAGGPALGVVQHYDRPTGELTVHDYAPTSCERCAEIAETLRYLR